jgi:hypothetical protein
MKALLKDILYVGYRKCMPCMATLSQGMPHECIAQRYILYSMNGTVSACLYELTIPRSAA